MLQKIDNALLRAEATQELIKELIEDLNKIKIELDKIEDGVQEKKQEEAIEKIKKVEEQIKTKEKELPVNNTHKSLGTIYQTIFESEYTDDELRDILKEYDVPSTKRSKKMTREQLAQVFVDMGFEMETDEEEVPQQEEVVKDPEQEVVVLPSERDAYYNLLEEAKILNTTDEYLCKIIGAWELEECSSRNEVIEQIVDYLKQLDFMPTVEDLKENLPEGRVEEIPY